MTLEQLIVGLVRLAGALPVLRWAFAGALIAIAVDFSDLFLMNLLDLGGLRNYQAFDKWLDLAYMATFLVVALRWSGRSTRPSSSTTTPRTDSSPSSSGAPP